MSPSHLPQLGSVVWAELADANGFRKVRPAVVISTLSGNVANQPTRLAAITTRLPNPLPVDYVLLPWDRQGKARSGLRRKCAAVAFWLAEIPVTDIRQVVGILPPGVMDELLARILAITASPPVPPAEK